MKTKIRFTKMQGSGNDYIYINTFIYKIASPEEFAKKWSRLHTGIGSDGLVLIGDSKDGDFSMRIFNADGSEAMMCGNASRCVGKYLFDNKMTEKKEITLDTLSGIKILKLFIENDQVNKVTVDMGEPAKEPVIIEGLKTELLETEISVDDQTFKATAISMGNPHLVIFVEDITTIDLEKLGPKLENHDYFPNRINVEFAQVLNKNEIRMRVWERGSGITQACGTGACATAVAGTLTGRTEQQATIIMDGGTLAIDWDASTNKVFMTGDAVTVFEGEIED